MLKGKSLTELAQELERVNSEKRDFMVPVNQLAMNEKSDIEFGGESFGLNNWSGGQIATYTNIPKQYFDRIKKENPELLAQNVNHGFEQITREKSDQRLIRTLDNNVRGFLSSKYRMLDSHDLLEATLPTLIENKFDVVSSEITEKRLYLKSVTPKIQGEVKKGDVVQYGVMISTSDVGAGSLKVEPFFNRLVCLNGMVMPTKFRKAHLGSNNFEREVHELLTDDTKKKNDEAFFATVRDYLMATMEPERFRRELEKMQHAADQKIENTDLERVVELTMDKTGVRGKKTKQGILNALASGNEGAGLTQWGLANSFTRAAYQIDKIDYETSTDLERAGGMIIDLKSSEWRRVAC